MANEIIVKRSAVAGKVPTTTDLELGELAVNTYDGKLYLKKDVSGTQTVVQVGGGDVSSSSTSSVDNAITRFDGTTGKLIQNSVATLDDTGVLTTLGANLDYMQIDTTATETIALGKTRWNAATGTQAFGIIDGTIECNVGEQMYAYVVNAEATTITAGQAVYLYQATGNKASVKLAYNTGDATSAKTLGLVVADIAAGATGFVITQGVVGKLDTSTFAEGDTLYLGATAGSLTATKPSAPNHLVYIGVVERSNAGNGQIYVRPQNGYELDEIHDVAISSPANGQTIIYDASTSLWKNANLTAGTGIGITNGASSITIANSGVLGVTATSPIASSGGQNPVISMPAATTSVSGYLTSTDWNTFNNKGNGTVTSVTAGTGLSGGTITSSGTISLANTAVTAGSYTYASITVDAQGRLTAASSGASPSAFPAGTAMLFVQTAAPTGWTKSTAHDNKALRIVSGTASSGGSVAFTTAFASQTPTGTIGGSFTIGATTLSTNEMPSHAHNVGQGSGSSGILEILNTALARSASPTYNVPTSSIGGGGSHTHSISGSPTFTGNAINLAVQYVDVIIATKD